MLSPAVSIISMACRNQTPRTTVATSLNAIEHVFVIHALDVVDHEACQVAVQILFHLHDPKSLILVFDLYKSKDDGALDPAPAWRILQEPRSLLITAQDLYTEYLHGIADVTEDGDLSADTICNWTLLRSADDFSQGLHLRETRTSLTYRDVMKVTKLGSKLGLLKKI